MVMLQLSLKRRRAPAWTGKVRLPTAQREVRWGGAPGEGEDIEVVEMTLEDALAAIRDGRIVDAKTIILVQHLELERLAGR